MNRNKKFITITILLAFILLISGQVFADYTGPNTEARNQQEVVWNDQCYKDWIACPDNPNELCEQWIGCYETTGSYYPAAVISITGKSCSSGSTPTGWCTGNYSVSLRAGDSYGKITGFECSDGRTISVAAADVATATFDFTEETNNEYEFWALTGISDTSEKVFATVQIDRTAPVNGIQIDGNYQNGWYSGPVTITSTAADTFLNSTLVGVGDAAAEYSYTIPNSFSGTAVPKVKSTDLAGNVSGWENFPEISIDNEVPQIVEKTDTGNKWYAEPVSISIKGSDAYSGIAAVLIKVDNEEFTSNESEYTITYSTEGWHQVYYQVTDLAGNKSELIGPFEFGFDKTLPVNDVVIEGELSEHGWYKGAVKIKSAATDDYLENTWVDAGFGETLNEYTVENTYSGEITPKVRSVDKAGNDTGFEAFEKIYIDNEIPGIKNLYDPNGKWHNSPVPLFVLGSDSYSGVLSGYIYVDNEKLDVSGNAASVSYSTEEGEHTVSYEVEDRAGNKTELSGPYTFGYDITLPEITLNSNQSFDIVGPIVTVGGEVSDSHSGVRNVEIRYGNSGTWIPVTGQPSSGATSGVWTHVISSGTAEGFNIFYVRVTDIAGNISNFTSFTLNKDHTAPEVVGMRTEGTKGEGGVYSGAVTFIGEATDSVAGVKNIYVDLGLGSGEKIFQDTVPNTYSGIVYACVRAIDNVGNSTECQKQDGVMVDNEKPYAESTIALDPQKVYQAKEEFSFSGADALSGMYSVTISIDGTPFECSGGSCTVEIGQVGDGTHTIDIVLKDKAGNTLSKTDTPSLSISGIISDGTSPMASISIPSTGTYVKDEAEFKGNVSDNIRLAKAEIKIDGNVIKSFDTFTGLSSDISETLDVSGYSEGQHTIELIAYDKAGNVSQTASTTFIVDRTIPTVSFTSEGTKGDGGDYRGIVAFTGHAEDTGAGVDKIFINIGEGEVENKTSSKEGFSGEVSVCVRSIDKVGNDTECVDQGKVLIDNDDPYFVSYTRADSKAVFTADDIFEVTSDDDHSGMYSVTIIIDGTASITDGDAANFSFSELEDGEHTIEFVLTDKAGNIYDSSNDASASTGKYIVDKTAPSVDLEMPSDNEYAGDSVIVKGTAEDNIGLLRAEISIDGTMVKSVSISGTGSEINETLDTSELAEGEHTVSVIVFDQGEIPSEVFELKILVDHTAPECHIELSGDRGPGGHFFGEIKVAAVCTDAAAGLETAYVNIGSGRIENETVIPADFSGVPEITAAGIDKVGNDSGDMKSEIYLMPDNELLENLIIDNTPPRVIDYFIPSEDWVRVEYLELFVTGEDDEGDIYSGTIIVNDVENVILADNNTASIHFNIAEGISSLEYYVTDMAGHNSEVISRR